MGRGRADERQADTAACRICLVEGYRERDALETAAAGLPGESGGLLGSLGGGPRGEAQQSRQQQGDPKQEAARGDQSHQHMVGETASAVGKHCPMLAALRILTRLVPTSAGSNIVVRQPVAGGLEPEWRNGSAADL